MVILVIVDETLLLKSSLIRFRLSTQLSDTSYLATSLSSGTRQSRGSSRSRGSTLTKKSRGSLLSRLTLKTNKDRSVVWMLREEF